MDSINQNLCPGVPTSPIPIPAARTLLPYPLATPTPDQENKSLATSIIAQDNVNGNFLPDETIGRKFILPIAKQVSILDKLTLSEKKIPLKLGVALMREAMQGLKKSEADVVTMLRPFLPAQEQNIQELLAHKHTIELAQTQPMGASSTISDQI